MKLTLTFDGVIDGEEYEVLLRLPCGKREFDFYSKARNSLDFKFVLVPLVTPDSVAPTLHGKNGRGNTFFT